MQFSLPSVALVVALLHMLLKALFHLLIVRPAQILGGIGLLMLFWFSTHPQHWQNLAADEALKYQIASPGMVRVPQCMEEGDDVRIAVEFPGGREPLCPDVDVPVGVQADKTLHLLKSVTYGVMVLSFGLEFLLFGLGKSSLFVFPAWRSVSGHGRGGRL
ncbi:hypothetical protein I5Q23_22930 [Serratia marcescens]|nr:hypothetical protein [Serratia marcescens]